MKKIFTLFVLVLMSCMGAWAFEAGTYTIKPYSDQTKYVVPSATWATRGGNKTAYATEATNENGGEWAIAATGSKFYFSPANTSFARGYLNPWSSGSNASGPLGCWDTNGDNSEDLWTITPVEGLDNVYTISGVNSTYMYYNGSESELYYNKPGTPTETNYFVIEKVVAPFPGAGTHYLTFKGKDSGRPQYLYHDLTQADGFTLASTTQGTTNAYIWRAECDGTKMTSIKNGQGQTVGMYGKHSDGTFQTNALTYTAHSGCYYLMPYAATGMKSTHDCLNQSNSASYSNSAGTKTLTSWSTTSGPDANDNHWYVTEVTDKDFYDVVITDGVAADGFNYSVASYANYDGQHAANGGFFAVAKGTTIDANDVTVTNLPSGKQAVVAVNDHTINITFETPANAIEVTYTFKIAEQVIGTVNRWEVQNGTPTISDIIPSYVNVVSGMPDAVTEDAYTIVTSYTGLPFEVGEKCYKLDFSGGIYYIFANSSYSNAKETTNYVESRDYKWQMGGNWFTGFTFRNLSGYYIAAPNKNPGNEVSTTVPTTLNDNCYFDVVENGSLGFRFKVHGGTNYLAHTSSNNLNVQFYDYYTVKGAYNSANQIRFTEVERISAADVTELQEKVDAVYAKKDLVGYPKMTSIASYTDGGVTKANYDEVNTAFNALYTSTDINLPEDGKAYKISAVHVNTNGTIADHYYLYSTADGQITNSVNGDNETYCKFIAKRENGGIVLVNELGNYLCWFDGNDGTKSYSTTGCNSAYSATHNVLTIEHANTTCTNSPASVTGLTDLQRFGLLQMSGLQANGTTRQYFVSDHTNNNAKHFVSGNAGDKYYGATSHTFLFQFEEVENTNKVKLSNPNPSGNSGLDNKSVGTFSAPFAVQLPTGVEAYKATVDGSTVTFENIGSVVPANTGVLVYAENGDTYDNVNAVPAAAVAPTVESNALRPANGEIAAGTYVLGKGSNGVGFYARQTPTTVANKAYLEVPVGSNLSAFRFDFEDTVTGIEAIESNAVETVFDLQGRRVQNAKSGLYIVNGKKVIR